MSSPTRPKLQRNWIKRKWIRQRRLWRITHPAYKLHAFSVFVLVLWIILLLSDSHPAVVKIGLFATAAFNALGFAVYFFSLARKPVSHRFIKFLIVVGHAFVLIVSVVLARYMVSDAIELPAQDFELTVSAVALLIYLPTWLLISVSFSLLIYVISLLFVAFTTIVISLIPATLGTIYGNSHRKQGRMVRHLNSKVLRVLLNGTGAAVWAVATASLFDYFSESTFSNPQVRNLIRHIAYIADFQPSGQFPGLPCDERVRLHENGVVSLAKRQDASVSITTFNYQQSDYMACIPNWP